MPYGGKKTPSCLPLHCHTLDMWEGALLSSLSVTLSPTIKLDNYLLISNFCSCVEIHLAVSDRINQVLDLYTFVGRRDAVFETS